MVVFDCKRLKPEWTVGEVPETIYDLSKSGWIDSEICELWFLKRFFGICTFYSPTPLALGWPFEPLPTSLYSSYSTGQCNCVLFTPEYNPSNLAPMFWAAEDVLAPEIYIAEHPYHVVT